MNGVEEDVRGTVTGRPLPSRRGPMAVLLAACAVPPVVVLGGLVVVVGGGLPGLVVVTLVVVAALVLVASNADTFALRSSGAVPADRPEHARYHNLVEGLCVSAGLPKPRLFVIADRSRNALAFGRNPQRASIAVTSALLEEANRVELEAVIAHELQRIARPDLQAATAAVVFVGLPAAAVEAGLRRRSDSGPADASGAALLVGSLVRPFVPVLARLLHAVAPTSAAQTADFAAVGQTRYPPGMVAVLEKLHAASDTKAATGAPASRRATAHLWFADPTAPAEPGGPLAAFRQQFTTHPPLTDRIEALREL